MSTSAITLDMSTAQPIQGVKLDMSTAQPLGGQPESLGRDVFGEIPSNPITRIGHRIKQNLDLPKQIQGAADAIHEGIRNIREGGPSKTPEFLEALKQYTDPEKLAADLITGYITAGAPEIPTPKMGADLPWWKKTGDVAPSAEPSSAIDTAIGIGKKIPIPKIKAIAHLADFARKLTTSTETAPVPTPATPTGPPELRGQYISQTGPAYPGEGASIREGLGRAEGNQPLNAPRNTVPEPSGEAYPGEGASIKSGLGRAEANQPLKQAIANVIDQHIPKESL